MATFNPPPMPAEDWEKFLEFNKKVFAETGSSIIDVATLRMIDQYSRGSREPALNSSTTPVEINSKLADSDL